MSLFGPDVPKRVTKEEWEKILHRVYEELDEKERIELEKFFRADLFEPGVEAGISAAEFEVGMKWLRDNTDKHEFEESDLQVIEKHFAENLKD